MLKTVLKGLDRLFNFLLKCFSKDCRSKLLTYNLIFQDNGIDCLSFPKTDFG